MESESPSHCGSSTVACAAAEFAQAIAELTIDCRLNTLLPKGSDEAYWGRLASIDRLQSAWMDDTERRKAEAEWQELGGRTSGPAEWRARRAELGKVIRPAYERERASHCFRRR